MRDEAKVAPPQDTAQLRRLLLSREATGLLVPLAARMLLIAFGIVNTAVGLVLTDAPDASPMLAVLVFSVFTVALVVNLRLFLWLRQSRHIERAGLIGAGFDALLVLALSGLAQLAGAQEGLSVGYVFKTEMPIVALSFVAINGLALRARYPLIVGIGVMVGLIVPAMRLAWHPDALWTADRTVVYAGPGHDLSSIITIIIMAAGVVTAVCFAAHAARQTIRSAIAQELEHAAAQQAQLRVVMTEKVNAIARLVAGISHEVNTPIGALRSGVDTQQRVLQKISDGAQQVAQPARLSKLVAVGQQSLEAMHSAAERISNLEASLRALSHLDEADFRKVDLHEELAKVVQTLQRGPEQHPRVRQQYGQIPQLYLAASEFNQALLSLLSYAFEAAGSRGEVRVHTACFEGTVRLEIEDDGPAPPVERLQGLFDISLSAQGERIAAGLGLATAQSVIQRHGGALTAIAGAKQGTCFTIELPEGSDRSAPAADLGTAALSTGGS